MTDINEYVQLAVSDEKAVKTLQQRLSKISDQEAREYGKEQRRLAKRVAELDKLFAALYEDKVMEKITVRNYRLMAAKYEQEQMDIEARLSAIEAELRAKGRNDKGIADFVKRISEYKGRKCQVAEAIEPLT